MPLCRVSTIVIPNYPQRTKTHARDPGRAVRGRAYRGRVDIKLILDAADAEVPGLHDLARRFLKAEAGQLGCRSAPPTSWRAGLRENLSFMSYGRPTNS